MSLEDIYQDLILDHFRHPRCSGNIINPDKQVTLRNPLCGDQISLEIKVKDGVVSDIGFTGSGCSISQAGASLMSELIKGKSVDQAKELADIYRRMMRGEASEDELNKLGDARALEGIKRFTARIKCALLAWDCIERAVEDV